MQAHRSLRRRGLEPAPSASSCGTGGLSQGLRVGVFVVVVVVVVALMKSGQSMLDAFGLVTVAAGTATQISSWLGQSAAALLGEAA
ncbi:hypothetical protein WDV06_26495 [Streptomyces racemochromogenes]|uniref:Uncharacterized protein n=1 Tax=Streptomyces racemochromogenes TaxID=67353 RepID=A0ABW7PJM0_9ACTN